MFSFWRKSKPPLDKLTIRILADVNDVDPQPEEGPNQAALQETTLPPVRLVQEPFLPGIAAHLCLDLEDGFLQWLSEEDVAEWRMPRAALFTSAIGNLEAKVPQSKLNKVTSEGSVIFGPLCAGVTLSSLVLADRFLADFGFEKDGVVAILPNRDTYYFCDKQSTESVDLLRSLVDVIWDDEACPKKYRITKNLLVADRHAPFGWAPLRQIH